MRTARYVMTGILWAVVTLLFCVAVGYFASKLARAEPLAAPKGACVQVDPASLVYTRMGYSLAIGDGHATVAHADVRYWDGALAYCIPPAGSPTLWMPSSAWPGFAHADGESGITLVHGERG